MKRLTNERGQHMFEYALLIGLVTVAALVMQMFARRSVQTGLQIVSDVVLEAPPAPEAPSGTPVTVSVAGCDGAATSATGSDVLVVAGCTSVTENGDASFGRATVISDTLRGAAVNEDTRLQFIKDLD